MLAQPDLGNAIIYLMMMLGMLWIGNMKYTHVLIGLSVVIVGLILFLNLFNTYHEQIDTFFKDHGKGHWVQRIDTFLNPRRPNRTLLTSFANPSLPSVPEVFGDGFLQGNSVHNKYSVCVFRCHIRCHRGGIRLPGRVDLLLIYFLLLYRMIIASIQSSTFFGSYIIFGIVSMFVFQIFENIGMLLGIMPITGITLPFISYGGTSLVINILAIGIVMSIRIRQDKKPNMNQFVKPRSLVVRHASTERGFHMKKEGFGENVEYKNESA